MFSLSGPHPLATKVVNFEPRVATSEIDRCAQGNGEIHISGTTTATQSSYPTVSVFGFSGSRYFADQDNSSVSPRSKSKFVVACQHS